jgi:26S proteasome regulatory subunit N3
MIEYIKKQNRNTLFLLGSKAYFYFSRSYELTNQLSMIRSELLKAFKTCCLKQDKHGQAVLMNLLLRNYIQENLYDQANQLITKSQTIDFHSNSQLARYFYYKGRIKSIQLDYSLAYDCLMQAIMKSPTGTAKGFRIACTKLMIIVKLLMGEIPEKSVFTQKGLKKSLEPYYALTKQVRVGDLLKFRKVVEEYSNVFKQDETYSLVQRIRQNVIRTGLKKISISYSKISLKDICEKLNLETPEDVEHIVAKAIRDGIIDASINHHDSFIQSNESIDVYSTSEPTLVFENRIEFCLNIHNDSVKALRFPSSLQKKPLDNNNTLEEDGGFEDDLLDSLDDEEDGMDEFGGL